MKRGFGSDNHSGVHPELLKAVVEANVDHEPSYGTDEYCARAEKTFRDLLGKQASCFFVFNGTGANVFALRSFVDRFESVICSDLSHLNVDECGAAESLGGFKLIPVSSKNGKIELSEVKRFCIRKGDQHFSQVKAISLTQPTETGTVYSLEEIKSFADWAHSQGLFLHIDGARIANAAVTLNCTFKEMLTDAGVDVISWGGTKNGFLFGEVVIFLNPELAKTAKYHRKQLSQLPSKSRFIACQFHRYLSTNLWKEIATHSMQKAQKLHEDLQKLGFLEITQPRQSNAVFVKIPQKWIKPLRENYFFYVWDEETFECRLMCSWDTTDSDIDGFIECIKSVKEAYEIPSR